MLEDRITARVPKHVKEKLQKAADIAGATLNQFIVQSALEKALEVIDRENRLKLSVEDLKVFYDAMNQPPSPTNRLKSAIERYRKTNVNAAADDDA